MTHKEYRAASKAEIPTITFVEPQVLHYKEVYDAAPDATMWTGFSWMDNPKKTFEIVG